jgi:thiamine biosynthesis lipoprotein
MAKKITLLFFLLFLFASCTKPIYKDKFVISGTFLEVISPYPDAAKIVYEEFKRLDKIFNLYDKNSELSKLNSTYNKPFKCSKELFEAILLAKEVYNLSDKTFDVSFGALYEFWKNLIKKKKIKKFPSQKEIERIKELGGMQYLEINEKERTITIKKKGLKIDLGALAKGYMVDKAVLKLKEKGIDSALINAGGDIYCLGKNRERFWKVGIKDPKKNGIIKVETLFNEAIATSGNYEQFFEFNKKKYSHLIDPRTGYPVKNNILSVSVITKNCVSADALSTAFFIMGLEGIKKFFSQHPSTMRIFVITEEKGKENIYIFK